jgi:hypothetical protein
MKRSILLFAGILLVSAIVAFAAMVTCPLHSYAVCYNTGQVSPTGSGALKWHCSCGDDVWVR